MTSDGAGHSGHHDHHHHHDEGHWEKKLRWKPEWVRIKSLSGLSTEYTKMLDDLRLNDFGVLMGVPMFREKSILLFLWVKKT